MRRWLAAAVAGAVLAGGGLAARGETPSEGIVSVETEDGAQVLRVEIADEPGERARGLMFRAPLPDRTGMLFLYDRPEPVAFWMKDTPSPLDILFIDPQGRVVRVARGEPLSRDIIRSPGAVAAVLEIRAGEAETLGIDAGDAVRWAVTE